MAKICCVDYSNAGQFCTNPGLLVAMKSAGLEKFKKALASAIAEVNSAYHADTGYLQKFSINYQKKVLAEEAVYPLSANG